MRRILPDSKFGDAQALGKLVKNETNPKLANRLNGIRLLMLDFQMQDVARICNVSRSCVEQWVQKWNQSGKEGLVNKSGGSKSKVTGEMRAEITKIVEVKIPTSRGIVTGKLIHGYLKKSSK